jgi:hypothetical protein
VITEATLAQLESRVVAGLDRGRSDGLDIVDYGEISTVLAAEGTAGPVVCKRLPVMTRSQLAGYEEVLADYLRVLGERGLTVAPTEVHAVGDDPVVPYCVQPRYEHLLVADLRSGDRALIEKWAARLCELVTAAAHDGVGLDGQVSNWAVTDDDLIYLDVTTPLLQDGAGNQRVDLDLFIASLPWAMRGLVRRFLLNEILSHYHSPRPVLLDAVANLYKERIGEIILVLLSAVNEVVDRPITIREARRYYRQDALMWELLQRLRRADRWWQRRVRRRRYPFLLPGKIERWDTHV